MRRSLAFGLMVLVAAVAGAVPPEATTRRLEAALESLEKDNFAGSYRLTTRAVVAKPDGSDRKDTLDVLDIRQQRGAEPEVVVVSATANGEDVAAKRREQLARQQAVKAKKKSKEKEEDNSISASMRLPLGKDLALFEFGPTREEGGALVASFAPRPSARKEKDLTQGTLAWDEVSGDPLWLEVTYFDPPTGVKELAMRFEIARQGEVLYLRRTTTKGVGGMLWIKRTFDLEMTITDLVPASQ